LDALLLLHGGGLDLPFIIVSGKIGEDIAVEAMRAGAHDYFLKGNLARLVPAIGREMHEAAVRREHRQAEEALRESEARYRGLFESAKDLIFTVSQEGLITSLNPAFETITGWPRSKWLGKHLELLVHPDDLSLMMELDKCFSNEIRASSLEMRILSKANRYLIMDVSMVPQTWNGKVVRCLGIARDITKRRKDEEKLKDSIKEKEILLREIHHRVKNNMQVISGLLMLQEELSDDEKIIGMLKDSQNRIASMALIHEKLYKSENLSKIDFKEYVDELVSALFESYLVGESEIALNINVENISLGIDLAIPCGLILNELVTNSLKYAFPDGKKGEIKISLHSTGEDMIELIEGDNGAGIPDDLDFRKTQSLGLHIVNLLVENQLHGEITLNKEGGTEFRIRFRGINQCQKKTT
ncbi:MAG: PAS domain S-box protein, partial [Candidatus Methanoperedens sp.]|nr:PAS domain S-box protein [Candidatus Methanoperedens sp.]